MNSILTVTTPAADPTLLTLAELQAAVGDAGVSDAALTALGQRVAAVIARTCSVPAAGATPPTLRLETLSETIEVGTASATLVLARRPVTEIVTVTEDGTALESGAWRLDAAAGLLRRRSADGPTLWPCDSDIEVAYAAGWATVPDDLKLAAAKLAAVFWSEGERGDPSLRSVEIPGVISKTFWVGPSDDPAIPAEVLDLLWPYSHRNVVF